MSVRKSPRIRSPRLARIVLATSMAIFAFGAVLFFWITEAEACSPVFPSPDCAYGDVDTGQVPDCLGFEEKTWSMDGRCSHQLELDNQCEESVELRFFCDEEMEQQCSDDRVLDPEEEEVIDVLSLENRKVSSAAGERAGTWEGSVGVSIQLLDTDSDNDNETENDSDDLGHGAHLEVEATHDDSEVASCPGPYGCSSTSTTEPLVVFLVFVAILALMRLGTPAPTRRDKQGHSDRPRA